MGLGNAILMIRCQDEDLRIPGSWVFRISGLASLIQTSTTIEQDALGQPPKQRVKRSTKDLKDQLANLCRARRDDMKTMQELLRGVAHTIRFS